MKTLTLTYPHDPLDAPTKRWKVIQAEQTTEFAPGEFLDKTQVDELCGIPKMWKVVIKAAK